MSGVLGQINVSFGPVDVDGRALPLDFKLEYRVPNETDLPSTTLRALFRQADERKWVEKGKTLVPDPTPYVLEHPALLELARGQNAYLAGRLVSDKVDSILLTRVSLQDTLDFRYFFPDGDDRISDLSLRAQNVTKLMLEISRQIAIFVFVDLFGVVGKTPSNAQFGGNIVSGLGLQFAGVLK